MKLIAAKSSEELQRNCSADTVCQMPKDRTIDRHKPGWKRPSRKRPELNFDPATMQASYLLTRRSMCAWVGVSIPTAELWAKNGGGPKITRAADGVPYYRVSDIRAFIRRRDRAKAKVEPRQSQR
jgi:hypothetical protein